VSGLEFGAEVLVFAVMESEIGVVEGGVFAGEFAGDEVCDKGEFKGGVEFDEVGVDLTGAHEVNACEKDAIDVKERFDAPGIFFFEKVPLSFSETEVVMGVMAGDAVARDGFEFDVFGCCLDDER